MSESGKAKSVGESAASIVGTLGGVATIKRVRKLNNGFVLEPDSMDPTYEPQVFNYNEPDTMAITVIGRVVFYVLPTDWEF